jgi:hypothetical protein
MASRYRLRPEEISDRCLARKCKRVDEEFWFYPPGHKNYNVRGGSCIVLREKQCNNRRVEGQRLCQKCNKNLRKYLLENTGRTEKTPDDLTRPLNNSEPWNGFIDKQPPSWLHMLDSSWGIQTKPVWHGPDPPPSVVSDTDSTESDTESMVSDSSEPFPEPPVVLGGAGGPSAPEPAPEPASVPEASYRERLLTIARTIPTDVLMAALAERINN